MKFIFLILMISCSLHPISEERRSLNEYYIGSGIEQYFLTDIPTWANFSETSKCQRDSNIRFLNYTKLSASYNFTYEQMLQLQLMFNVKLKSYQNSIDAKALLPKDEETIFYNVLDKIKGNVRDFIPPDFNEINLIWIDNALNNTEHLKRLSKLISSGVLNSGHPVFVSLCLSLEGMEKFLKQNKWDNQNIKLISNEMFSIFDVKTNNVFKYNLEFSELFQKMKKLNFYIDDSSLPKEFHGNFKIKNF